MATEIRTAQELSDIRNNLAGDYILMNDIDLSGWGAWNPIDDFEGIFDGGDYTISNLTLDNTYYSYSLGLFRYCNNAHFSNITIDNSEAVLAEDGYTVSLLAANADNFSTFDNCHIKNSSITATQYSGAMGGDLNNSTINNCSAEDITFTLKGTGDSGYVMGGLCAIGGETTDSHTKNIVFQMDPGNVSDFTLETTGGLASNIGPANNCYAKNISFDFPRYENVGGFIGQNTSEYTYEQCYAQNVEIISGGVSSTWGIGDTVGGFIGFGKCIFNNCYATGSITGVKSNVGGFAGTADWDIEPTEYVFKNCYSAVKISDYGSTPKDDDIGGFVGYYDTYDNVDIVHQDCYYDQDLADGLDSFGGVRSDGDEDFIVNPALARSTSEMTYIHASNTYLNWDFNNIWHIYPADVANDGYPVFEIYEIPDTNIYFIEEPKINKKQPQSNAVTVTSPTAEYTAALPNLSKDGYVERLIEINEGDREVCRIIAEKLLKNWSKELTAVEGTIKLRQDLNFKEKVKITMENEGFEDRLVLQKINHDIIEQKTKITAGDLILSDNELLSRLLADLN